ncbi:hypothetical protein [Micromonospora auratinigra]|uniref:hypothetical protein n=1 Tax=Micromonospora auratinigra TaxID=261654 RepID=UPI0012FE1A0C|nr:hypothetical protein [Micromonospora auratinigra]
MRPVVEPFRVRESWLVRAVGAPVALAGYALLVLLIDEGLTPAAANAVQLAATLGLGFLAHDLLVRCRRRTGRARRWRAFQATRGAAALVSLVAFPGLAPVVGAGAAYWGLLAVGAVVNHHADRFWASPSLADAAAPPHRWRGGHRRPLPSGWRLARSTGALAVLSLPAVLFLDLFLVAVSLGLLVRAVGRLALRLRERWLPEHDPRPGRGAVRPGHADPGADACPWPPVEQRDAGPVARPAPVG